MSIQSHIKNTVFKTSPDDALMAIDVYKDNVIKELGSVANGFDTSLAKAITNLQNGKLSFKDLKNIEKSIKGIVIKKDELLKRLNSQFGSIMNSAVGIKAALKDLTLEKFGEIAGLDLDTLKDVKGKKVKVSFGIAPQDARDLQRAINQATGDQTLDDLIDLQAKEAFSAALLDEAVKMGLTDSVTQVMAYFDDPLVANQYLTSSIHRYLEATTLEVIQQATAYLTGDAMIASIPRIFERILSSYRYSYSTVSSEFQGEFDRLVGTLSAISPDWMNYQFGEHNFGHSSAFMNASSYAKKILGIRPDFRYLRHTAGQYKQTNIYDLAKRNYPNAGI